MYTKQYYVYIMTNFRNTVLYVGVTGKPLPERIWEHNQKLIKGFTEKYNINKLVYYEVIYDPHAAINREKQLKAGSRADKIKLIETVNPKWEDLYNTIL